jgi:DNA-binding XRE family transcriptional regulator
MSARTFDFQTIEYEGNTAFVLIPFDVFRKIRPFLDHEATHLAIPHKIVKRNVIDGVPMIKAWREHLGMTQQELAKKADVTQPAIAKLERSAAKPRQATLKKLAMAMNITTEQLEE